MMTLGSNSSPPNSWIAYDGTIDFLHVARNLWRAKYIILLGAFVAAGVSFALAREDPTYAATVLLEHHEYNAGLQSPGTIVLVPPQDEGGVQLTVPSTLPNLSEPFNTEMLSYFVKNSSVTQVGLDEIFAKAAGIKLEEFDHAIIITDIANTPYTTVTVVMPSEETAIEAAGMLATAMIDMDREKFEDGLARTVLLIEGQLETFVEVAGDRLMSESNNTENEYQFGSDATEGLSHRFPKSAGMAEVRYLEMVSRYEQALAQQAFGYQRLSVLESARLDEAVTSSLSPPLALRTTIAFLGGALMASCVLLFVEYLLWLSRRKTMAHE